MQKHTIFWTFRALARPGICRNILFFGHSGPLQGLEYAETYYFLDIPGPCKAWNMQKHTIFWTFRALARPGICRNILFFGHSRALQGLEYAETYYFLDIPGPC